MYVVVRQRSALRRSSRGSFAANTAPNMRWSRSGGPLVTSRWKRLLKRFSTWFSTWDSVRFFETRSSFPKLSQVFPCLSCSTVAEDTEVLARCQRLRDLWRTASLNNWARNSSGCLTPCASAGRGPPEDAWSLRREMKDEANIRKSNQTSRMNLDIFDHVGPIHTDALCFWFFLHLSGPSGKMHQNANFSVILFAHLKGNLGVREKRCQGWRSVENTSLKKSSRWRPNHSSGGSFAADDLNWFDMWPALAPQGIWR